MGVFAGCDITYGYPDQGKTIQFAQLPGQSISIAMKDDETLSTTTDYSYRLVFYEGSEIYSTDDSDYCYPTLALVGNEFAPLAEIENGVENPYSDKSRGRIVDFKATSDGTEFEQTKFLGNILGKDSILGRSLFIYESDDDSSDPPTFTTTT